MAPSSVAIDTMQRLVDQVQALSSVAETLTLRLLELEERLQRQERAIAEPVALDLGALAERRLAESEQRLQGLEQMLASLPLPPGPALVALSTPADANHSGDAPIGPEAAHPAAAAGAEDPDVMDPEAIDPVADEPGDVAPGPKPAASIGAETATAAAESAEDEGWQVDADWDDLDRLTA